MEAPGEIQNGGSQKKIGACSSCALRRVKCVRPLGKDGNIDVELPCKSCDRQHLQCFALEKVKKSRKPGKGIEKCRKLYGSSVSENSKQRVESQPSGTSSAHFLSLFSTIIRPIVGTFISPIPESPSSPLHMCTVAIASPLSLSLVKSKGAKGALQRKAVHVSFLNAALDCLDRSGAYRKPSIEHIESFLLLDLASTWYGEDKTQSRIFLSVAIEQLRQISDFPRTEKFLHVLIRDALCSAYTGSPPLISDSEIARFKARNYLSPCVFKTIQDLRAIYDLKQSTLAFDLVSTESLLEKIWTPLSNEELELEPDFDGSIEQSTVLQCHLSLDESRSQFLTATKNLVSLIESKDDITSFGLELDIAAIIEHLRPWNENFHSISSVFSQRDIANTIQSLEAAENKLYWTWPPDIKKPEREELTIPFTMPLNPFCELNIQVDSGNDILVDTEYTEDLMEGNYEFLLSSPTYSESSLPSLLNSPEVAVSELPNQNLDLFQFCDMLA